MRISDMIKEERERHHETQAEIATVLNTAREQIWKYEKGKQEIPAYRIAELCAHWQVSANYILGLPEYPRPDETGESGAGGAD